MLKEYYKTLTTSGTLLEFEEVQNFLKADISDTEVIELLMTTACTYAEVMTGRDLYTRNIEVYFDGIHYDLERCLYYLEISRTPVNSITKTEVYVDDAYILVTDTVNEQIGHYQTRLYFSTLTQAPDVDATYPYKVTLNVGGNVLEILKTAMKAHIMYMWKNRGDVVSEGQLSAPLEALSIYGKYRVLYL